MKKFFTKVLQKIKKYDIVKKIHANMIQGYYFDRPMPAGAFEAKYTEQQDNIKAAGGSK